MYSNFTRALAALSVMASTVMVTTLVIATAGLGLTA